ncbi:DUF4259 domain-containing protein [Streptomyces sp. NBC_01210]|uniref:DUF4259 domain-containing protein n=1 Tax=Streptomyces sp. NBC_01210 TaxID=2903774 RepID=UPI002E10AEFD|nr:DUF4259 domain-containing protein [Streptomyces sp. NBC_01210]
MEERENLVRSALKRAANTADSLDASDAMRAVAAAALIVARCPGGEPTCPYYGPSDAMPEFPIDLRMLAVDALDQVVAEPSELAELYYEAVNSRKEWRQLITRLRDALAPPARPQEEALFEIQRAAAATACSGLLRSWCVQTPVRADGSTPGLRTQRWPRSALAGLSPRTHRHRRQRSSASRGGRNVYGEPETSKEAYCRWPLIRTLDRR